MSVGIVLIHGYTGRTTDLEPLYLQLVERFGAENVLLRPLPDHDGRIPSIFDREKLLEAVAEKIQRFRQLHRRLVVIGHSSGGSLAMLALAELGRKADLLILAGVPKAIDLAYLERWRVCRKGKEKISLSAVAGLVSVINEAGRLRQCPCHSLVVLHGEADELVPKGDSIAWKKSFSSGQNRLVLAPEAGHQIFCSGRADLTFDVIRRAVADLAEPLNTSQQMSMAQLQRVEPECRRFLERNPESVRHLAGSPSGLRLLEESPVLSSHLVLEPVFANIEITTRCNLACPHCARSVLHRSPRSMPLEMFERILDLLPHAYRITLVGLGEPILHPQVVELVETAKRSGRRVALATNAMELSPELSSLILAAGLDSIAFSLDTVDQALADRVRPGSDIGLISGNIQAFIVRARELERSVSTAVFTAISIETLDHLETLITTVKELTAHVLMLSDMNFTMNGHRTLWRNLGSSGHNWLRECIIRSYAAGLPVLSVRGLEEFGLVERYRDFLLLSAEQISQRSEKRNWCVSPWQTISVGVDGDITVCDCQPDAAIGNLLTQPLTQIWNGPALLEQRQRMLKADVPEACRVCPRL